MKPMPDSPVAADSIESGAVAGAVGGAASGVALQAAPAKPSRASLPSLPEVYRSVPISANASFLRKLLLFAGPGYLVAVGYMDPGNWATDIGGGSQFGYALLSVVILSSLLAIFVQALSAKLGIATGRDLAQACRESLSPAASRWRLWLLGEIAIAACDLAEVLGSAVALKLLFGIPLLAGVLITGADVLIVLALQGRGFRWIEALVVTLIATIAACFAYEIFFAQPLWREAATGLSLARDSCMTATCSISPSAFLAPPSCRTICICIPASCKRAPSASASRKARGRPLRHLRLHRGPGLFALCERRHPGPRRSGLPQSRPHQRCRYKPGLQAADSRLGRGLRQHSFCGGFALFRPELHADGHARRSSVMEGFCICRSSLGCAG